MNVSYEATDAIMAESNAPAAPKWQPGVSSYIEPTVFFMFGGGGLGAYGFQQAETTLRGMMARFRVVGGFDYDEYACGVFKYLTGVDEACMDVNTMTPEDLRRVAGEEAPDCVVSSAPCQGSSNLITEEKAATAEYQAMNELALVATRLMLKAWPKRPPKFIFFENVPSIVRRAKHVVEAIFQLLRENGYEVISGIHNALDHGEAQSRKRWFMVARHVEQVPHFLYRAPKLKGKVCGDVLGPMPLPGDPSAGPMHRMSDICARNWLRLWAIPAGQDWRALRPPNAEAPKRSGGGKGRKSSGEQLDLSRARPSFTSTDHVTPWESATRTIVAAANRPGNGGLSVADPRAVNLTPQAGNDAGYSGKFIVVPWSGHAKTITTADRIGSGAQSVAQPVDLSTTDSAFHHGAGLGRWGVLTKFNVSSTVIANARHNTGPFSYASDAPQPVDLVPREECYDKAYGVLDMNEPSHTIAACPDVGCGAYARPAPVDLSLGCSPHPGAYGVTPATEPACTILASSHIDNSNVALADPDTQRVQPYVMLTYEQTKAIVDGYVPLPFAVCDPAAPNVPLAIVDSWERSPYRWETITTQKVSKRGKVTTKTTQRKVNVPLVLISADGMWHRPMTTKELARLMGLPEQHNGRPLNFGGGSTEQRRVVGNGICTGVAAAFGEQVLLALTAAAQGAFYLDAGGAGVWVDKTTAREMRADGVRVVKPHRAPFYGDTVAWAPKHKQVPQAAVAYQ